MELFEKLLTKTKEITGATINQTKSISDISKLKAQQKTAEKNLTGYYCQLGKAYYENSGNKCDYIYSELVSVIDKEREKLSSVIKKIDCINGVRRCKSCKAKVSADSIFCNICGARLEDAPVPVEEPDEKTPIEAVTEDSTNDIIIEETDAEAVKDEITGEPEAAAAEESAEDKRLCLKCGAEVPDWASFCTNCGTKYEDN